MAAILSCTWIFVGGVSECEPWKPPVVQVYHRRKITSDTGDCKLLWPDSAEYLQPEPVKSGVSV